MVAALGCSSGDSDKHHKSDVNTDGTPDNNEEVPLSNCDVPHDFLTDMILAPNNRRLIEGVIDLDLSTIEGSCGGDGRERVYIYQAEEAGLLQLYVSSDEALSLSVQETCGDSSSELLCAENTIAAELQVEADQVLYLVVDSPADITRAVDFSLSATLLPYIAEGDDCDVEQALNRCAEGLRCDFDSETCVANEAPLLTSAVALRTGRDGTDLYISFEGSDADGDAYAVSLNGALYFLREWSDEPGDFDSDFVAYGYFTSHPDDTQVTVAIGDSGGLISNTMDVEIDDAPVIDIGEECDSNELSNICYDGYVCPENTGLCTFGGYPSLDNWGFFASDVYGDKRIVLEGFDAGADINTVVLEFYDDNYNPIEVNVNGQMLSTLNVAVTQGVNNSYFFTTIVANILPDTVTIVNAQLFDRSGSFSAEESAGLEEMPIVDLTDDCDPKRNFNHCEVGAFCSEGEVCEEGTAPEITRAAYLERASGDQILIEAADSDGDLLIASLSFYDADDEEILLFDTDGNDISDTNTAPQWVKEADKNSDDNTYFMQFDVSALSAIAPIVHVALSDSASLVSDTVTLTLATVEVKNTGDDCSYHGFDQCEAGSKCPSTEVCARVEDLRASSCSAGDLYDSDLVTGATLSPSLWDPPVGCTEGNPHNAPEGVVRLTLAEAADTLTISTDHEETHFDTILYLLDDCGETGGQDALGCDDDVNIHLNNYTSTLTLYDVPAGDYLIVVDSYDAYGGEFAVSVEVQ